MACETVGTAAGTALARVSMVDSGGETVLDMLVKPPDAVTDYRTQRSGITEGLLRHITSTLADAQRAVKPRNHLLPSACWRSATVPMPAALIRATCQSDISQPCQRVLSGQNLSHDRARRCAGC